MGNSQSARAEHAVSSEWKLAEDEQKKEGKEWKLLLKERQQNIQRHWHLYGKAYDLKAFLNEHPGGAEAIALSKGIPDATALFESYHPSLTVPKKVLEKYEVGPSPVVFKTPHGYTYEKDGFYAKIRARVLEAQRKAGYGSGYWKAGTFGTLFAVCHLYSLVFLRYALWHGMYPPLAMAVVTGVLRGLMITRTAHSASHFAFSRYPIVNSIAYRLAMTAMGGSAEHWTNQHVVRHHIETNIIPIDYDTMYPVKRSLGYYKPLWFHKYQHLYMWALYPVTMIAWTLGDIAYAFHPRNKLGDKMASLSVSALFMAHAWVLPYLCLPFWEAWWMIGLEVVVSSIFFSSQFIVNHEVVGTEGHSTDRDWGEYQVISSHDYGISPTKNPTWSEWAYCNASGGLSNQIAHHLYPSTHYSHYPRITRAIREVCKEEGVAFNESSTLPQALYKHYLHLKEMGSAPTTRRSKENKEAPGTPEKLSGSVPKRNAKSPKKID